MARHGPKTELDLPRTLRAIFVQGNLADLIMMPQRMNLAKLTLLIDSSASMIGFHELGRRLLDTARGGQFRSVQVFYFNNVIEEYLFQDFGLSEGLTFEDFCAHSDVFFDLLHRV